MLRELLRSLKEGLPILLGVAGPLAIASVALLAWSGVLPMKAVTLPWRRGLALWTGQAVLGAWPLWALRRRLLPEAWCVQLRCLPLAARALLASDAAVSAVVLAPLAALYALSALVFAIQRPAWWTRAMPAAALSLAGCWLASCALGAAALAWQRRGTVVRAVRAARAQAPEALLSVRPGIARALLWWPAWRGALVPGPRFALAGIASALVLAAAWTRGWWPLVPGAAWALAVSGLAIAQTERLQRAMELHLQGLSAWMDAMPAPPRWRLAARAAVCAPMMLAGAAVVALVLATRPWRAAPLLAFALAFAAAPVAMTSVPASNREGHVALWAVCAGLLTAFGSELWN